MNIIQVVASMKMESSGTTYCVPHLCESLIRTGANVQLHTLSQSECLILPTFSENFGMVVTEALAAETCAICTRDAPWQGLNTNRCGISCDGNESAIEVAMREIMASSREENTERGKRGKLWMQQDFSWDNIAVKIVAAYQWLLEGSEKPEWGFIQ